MGAATNPFATRFVQPGAIPWVCATASDELATLADRLATGGSWQVLGPHGTGKTTLLRHLQAALERSGRRAVFTRAPRRAIAAGALGAVVLADEVESWPFGALALLRAACRVRNATLVVSCHRDLGLSTLHERRVDVELAVRVVEQLVGATWVEREQVAALLERHRGDLRELLFALYDRHNAGR